MADINMEEMIKAVSENPDYKVLTEKEHELLVLASKGAEVTEIKNPVVKDIGSKLQTSTPKAPEEEVVKPKFTFPAPGSSSTAGLI